MIREQALRKRERLVGKLPVTGELLRGSLLERTFRHTKDCPKCARGEGHRKGDCVSVSARGEQDVSQKFALRLVAYGHAALDQKRFHGRAGIEVLGLVARSKCSAYDCEFVALAHSLEVPLVTEDKQLLATFPRVCHSLKRFVSAK